MLARDPGIVPQTPPSSALIWRPVPFQPVTHINRLCRIGTARKESSGHDARQKRLSKHAPRSLRPTLPLVVLVAARTLSASLRVIRSKCSIILWSSATYDPTYLSAFY